MDIFEKCYGYTEARDAMENGSYPYFIPMTKSEGSEAVFQGRRLIMCGSNNYLGLTADPRVRQAAIDAVQEFGTSCTGSRFLNGTLELHEQLEHELAEWVGKEAALVFSTGMQTNLGVISAMVMRGDVVLLDKEDHASLVDGARLALGETRRFRHNDMADLERVLAGIPADKGRLVVVDGLYSMGGDLALLPEITALCKKYGARLMVDDAHGLGVMGGGRGTATHFGLTDQVDLIMSTFSKSFASLGGFIAGDEQIIHYIKHHARSLIFSASMTPASTAAVLAVIDIMKSEPERIKHLWDLTHYALKGFKEMGINTGKAETPIIPLFIRDDIKALQMTRMLLEEGVFVNPVVAPAVPKEDSMIRFSLMATHTFDQVRIAMEKIEKIAKKLGAIASSSVML